MAHTLENLIKFGGWEKRIFKMKGLRVLEHKAQESNKNSVSA